MHSQIRIIAPAGMACTFNMACIIILAVTATIARTGKTPSERHHQWIQEDAKDSPSSSP